MFILSETRDWKGNGRTISAVGTPVHGLASTVNWNRHVYNTLVAAVGMRAVVRFLCCSDDFFPVNIHFVYDVWRLVRFKYGTATIA